MSSSCHFVSFLLVSPWTVDLHPPSGGLAGLDFWKGKLRVRRAVVPLTAHRVALESLEAMKT